MRRLILLPIVVFGLAVVLVACGDDGADHDMGDMGDMNAMDHADEANTPVVEGAREIAVTGTSFEFDPEQISVTAGEDVTIVLTSDDILHDFTLEDADGHVAADAGETASGGLRIDEPGTYTFYCSVAGHREAGMEGTLVVE